MRVSGLRHRETNYVIICLPDDRRSASAVPVDLNTTRSITNIGPTRFLNPSFSLVRTPIILLVLGFVRPAFPSS